jgi:ABC-type multidrug transport system ATPase subunit
MQIALESLSKRFGKLRALENVTATIEPGQIIAILGSNGAGKTTLLCCLSAIGVPDGGRILFDGQVFCRGRNDLRQRLYFLPDFPVVFAQMTVARHLAMVLGLYNKSGDTLAADATEHLAQLDILATVDTPIGQLSRGQIYKVALATLLTIDPDCGCSMSLSPQAWILREFLISSSRPGWRRNAAERFFIPRKSWKWRRNSATESC